MITADMLVKDVLAAHPETAAVLAAHGLPCSSCLASSLETVADVANAHELDPGALLEALSSAAGGEVKEESR